MWKDKDVLLRVEDLSRVFYRENGRELWACKNISFSLQKGETLAIVGESGSGKSTLMKLIMRMLPVTSGAIYFKNRDWLALSGGELRKARPGMQMVFQHPIAACDPRMNVSHIICEPLRNYRQVGKLEGQQIARQLLEQVGLDESFLRRYPHEMSGGQCQRVAIARALVLEPDLLICDEATSALDMSVQDGIAKLLVRLQKERGVSYLFVCHDIALAQSISHRMLVMHDGQVVEVLPSKQWREASNPYTKKLIEASL